MCLKELTIKTSLIYRQGNGRPRKGTLQGTLVVATTESAFLVPGSEPQKEVLGGEELEQSLTENVGPGPLTVRQQEVPAALKTQLFMHMILILEKNFQYKV